MSSTSRRLARALGRIARESRAPTRAPATTSRASTSRVGVVPVGESVPNARRRVADARAFAASTTGALGRYDRGGDAGTRERASASTRGADEATHVALAAKGETTTEQLAALAGLEFRTWHRNHSSRADETFGATVRERWRRTYSKKGAFAALYSIKFTMVKFFLRIGRAPFAATFALGAYVSLKVCTLVSLLGMVGFLVVAKVVGAGDWAVGALAAVREGFQYVTGRQAGFTECVSALVSYRTMYYTLPVVLFAYEELYYFAARFRRFARWLGR